MDNLFTFLTNSLSFWAFSLRVFIVSTKPAQLWFRSTTVLDSTLLMLLTLDINPFMNALDINASRIIPELYRSELTALKSQPLAKVFNSFKYLSKASPGFCFQARITLFFLTYSNTNVSIASSYLPHSEMYSYTLDSL